MATVSTYKVLGQVVPAAATNTTLYTVPPTAQTVTSTMSICNQGAIASVRIAVRPLGAALASQHYVVFDTTVNPNDTLFLTLGMSLSSTDVITVYSTTATVSFNLFGSEIE